MRRFRVEITIRKGTDRGVVVADHPRDAYTKFAIRKGFLPARIVNVPKGTKAKVSEVGAIKEYVYENTAKTKPRAFRTRR